MFLVCQVISEDHVDQELFDFMDRNILRPVTSLPSLVAIGTVVVEIYWF